MTISALNYIAVCKHCGKKGSLHRAKTLECPMGLKTRIGYTSFGPNVFDPKPLTKKQQAELDHSLSFKL